MNTPMDNMRETIDKQDALIEVHRQWWQRTVSVLQACDVYVKAYLESLKSDLRESQSERDYPHREENDGVDENEDLIEAINEATDLRTQIKQLLEHPAS